MVKKSKLINDSLSVDLNKIQKLILKRQTENALAKIKNKGGYK